MFKGLDIFRLSSALAAHAAQRQAVTAANVANADTPGYRAGALDDFPRLLARGSSPSLRISHPAHLPGAADTRPARIRDAKGQAKPNGNTVSLEREMMNSVQASQQQARALAIYRHGLNVLRLASGGK